MHFVKVFKVLTVLNKSFIEKITWLLASSGIFAICNTSKKSLRIEIDYVKIEKAM
jgi:hypothetical protein